MTKKLKIIFCTLSVFAALHTMACTNFIITKGASTDGSCVVSYAADSHTLYGELYYRAAADYPAGTMMDVYEWDTGKKLGQIPQAAHTYSVVGNMNEHQLAIGETTFGGREILFHTPGMIDYGSLIYITLQRAKNAREAIKIISFLVDNYGYCSEGESFSIVDPNEAWIFEIVGKGQPFNDTVKGKITPSKYWSKGAVWVARRIPDGYICGHANQARIATFPLRDGKTSITSKEIDKMLFNPGVATIYAHDVVEFAKARKMYDPAKDGVFSFCDVYCPLTFSGARGCEARVWTAFYRCNPELMKPYEKYARGEDLQSREKMPLWIKPVNKVSVQDVMQLMRDHYEGTSMDMTKDLGAGPYASPYRWRPMNWDVDGKKYIHERATATQQTGFSFVAQCRSSLPNKFGGVFWFGVDDAGSSCYMPVFCGITQIPEAIREGNGSMTDYSPTAAYWIFTKVSNWVYTRYKDMIVHVKEKQNALESSFVKEILNMETEMVAQFEKDPNAAVARLNKFTHDKVQMACQTWNDLFTYLLVKYNDGNVKKEKDGKFLKTDTEIPQCAFPEQPKYPDNWYRMIVKDCGTNIEDREME
ncbi:MAG: C69 family dipeptidase [Bacteroidales bacterium]|jgi:dipeptidase|nr:C69 family dipeptidase [Bacteroidales bacterium]